VDSPENHMAQEGALGDLDWHLRWNLSEYATYNSHHDPQITEPHLYPNIMETSIIINFSCATKLP
jgi:hypothetical protein